MGRSVPVMTMGVAAGAGVLLIAQAATLAQPRVLPAQRATTSEVVARMVAMNTARTDALHAFSAVRSYNVSYSGLGHAQATMTVRVDFRQPGPKKFTILAESGSGMLRHHVLEPLVKAEQRDAVLTSNEGSAIVPANYRFRLVATPDDSDSGSYVLDAIPRQHGRRFLFRGKIWVNAQDFGIERVRGKLPHSPSFWVTNATFDYHSQKIGDFWLPATNQTRAHIRFFGHATLEIRYHDFTLTSISPVLTGGLAGGRR